ncbi:MAG: metalloregulator ArsR/SmtB family transcription factor [bacterium]|nr:metalloregulator ArsR/SmtB family transcription factor [bacterium]
MQDRSEALGQFKEKLYEQFGVLGRAISSPRRLELLDLLCQGERSVEHLADEMGLTSANVSQHLRVLKEARLVEATKDGLYMYYHIADPAVVSFWVGFRQLAMSRLAEVRELLRSFQSDEEFEAIDPTEVQQRLAEGSIYLLDVRPETEYRCGHLPGAASLPLADLNDKLGEVPTDREVVVYCRGPFCIMADEAVRAMRERGIKARSLKEGPMEWRALGMDLETN